MTRRLIANPSKALKDNLGAYLPEGAKPLTLPRAPLETDLSIDALKHKGLQTIQKIMNAVWQEASIGMPARESIMSLKDCMTMLKDLKNEERELLESMSDEQLEALAKK